MSKRFSSTRTTPGYKPDISFCYISSFVQIFYKGSKEFRLPPFFLYSSFRQPEVPADITEFGSGPFKTRSLLQQTSFLRNRDEEALQLTNADRSTTITDKRQSSGFTVDVRNLHFVHPILLYDKTIKETDFPLFKTIFYYFKYKFNIYNNIYYSTQHVSTSVSHFHVYSVNKTFYNVKPHSSAYTRKVLQIV